MWCLVQILSDKKWKHRTWWHDHISVCMIICWHFRGNQGHWGEGREDRFPDLVPQAVSPAGDPGDPQHWAGGGYSSHRVSISNINHNIFIIENNCSNDNCEQCPCKSRSPRKIDKCSIARTDSTVFYFSTNVHKTYRDMTVVVEGDNIKNVSCIEGCQDFNISELWSDFLRGRAS